MFLDFNAFLDVFDYFFLQIDWIMFLYQIDWTCQNHKRA